MNRKPEPESPDASARQAPAPADPAHADGNPNERVGQWESEYFEKPADAGRGDPGPNP